MLMIIILAWIWKLKLSRIVEVSLTLRTMIVPLLLLLPIIDEFIQIWIIWINMHAVFLLEIESFSFIPDIGWRIFSNFASQL
jgi:hypothetical protein